MKIIFLNAFHGSGKDATHKEIKKRYPNFIRMSIADGIKDIAATKYNFKRELADTEEKDIVRAELGNRSIRDVCRIVGFECQDINLSLIHI